MLRITIFATAIAMLMLGAVSAQTDKMGLPGYSNTLRSDLERKNDKEVDRAYQSTIKTRPDIRKEQSDPWGDVRPQSPAAAKNK
jgi:hypothetical protein